MEQAGWLKGLESVERLLKSRTFALVIFLTCLIVLCLPAGLARSWGIEAIREQYRGVIAILMIASSLQLCIVTGADVIRRRKARRRVASEVRAKEERIRDRLKGLPGDARTILAYCLYHQQHTICLPARYPAANVLKQEGFLRGGPWVVSVRPCPFIIPPHIWQILCAHKAALLPRAVQSDPDFQESIRQFEDFLRRKGCL